MKELFGWLIAVCRRWALGSSYDVKTSRAIYGISLVCAFYIFGICLNIIMFGGGKYLNQYFDNWDQYLAPAIIFKGFLPLIILKKIFYTDTVEYYIHKYEASDLKQNVRQQLLALIFVIGAWFIFFGPFWFK